jgi:hypothetical protein
LDPFRSHRPALRRREFLRRALGTAGASALAPHAAFAQARRPALAAIVVGYNIRWHTDNIVTRLLEGHWINGTFHEPRCRIASLYSHSARSTDVGRRLAASYGFRACPTVAEALTLGTGSLKVDGVVTVSEAPGNLVPFDENPFRQFFEEIVAVFRKSNRSVPVFNDKQLSSRWPESKWMYEQSRELGFPMLAGSTISLTFRRPELDLAPGTPIEEAVVLAAIPMQHVQSITFHALELLQSIVERRPGGETGVRALEFLEGEAVWQAAARGRWSGELFEAAASRSLTRPPGKPEQLAPRAMALLIEYNDGFRAAVVGAPGFVGDYTVAARIKGRPEIASTLAFYPGDSGNSFSCLVRHVERLMLTREAAVPIERTLLTSGIIDLMLRSRRERRRVETPELALAYRTPAAPAYCSGPGS